MQKQTAQSSGNPSRKAALKVNVTCRASLPPLRYLEECYLQSGLAGFAQGDDFQVRAHLVRLPVDLNVVLDEVLHPDCLAFSITTVLAPGRHALLIDALRKTLMF